MLARSWQNSLTGNCKVNNAVWPVCIHLERNNVVVTCEFLSKHYKQVTAYSFFILDICMDLKNVLFCATLKIHISRSYIRNIIIVMYYFKWEA
jgi:hypothetical protein